MKYLTLILLIPLSAQAISLVGGSLSPESLKGVSLTSDGGGVAPEPNFISVWPIDQVAGGVSSDPADYELGVQFSIDVAVSPGGGYVHAIEFHKNAANTPPHVANLWRVSDGALLATTTFASETASGWQVQFLESGGVPAPVKIDAGVNYIASYSIPNGRFSLTSGGLSGGKTTSPIILPPSAARVSPTPGAFPTISNANNYWVDIVWAEIQ